jgi:hypothetical protein
MSALGQKQTCAMQLATSAMGHKRTSRHLFNHLITASEQCRRHCQAAGLCGNRRVAFSDWRLPRGSVLCQGVQNRPIKGREFLF